MEYVVPLRNVRTVLQELYNKNLLIVVVQSNRQIGNGYGTLLHRIVFFSSINK